MQRYRIESRRYSEQGKWLDGRMGMKRWTDSRGVDRSHQNKVIRKQSRCEECYRKIAMRMRLYIHMCKLLNTNQEAECETD